MAERKTSRNNSSVDEFIDGIADDVRRRDAHYLKDLIAGITGDPPEMWGTSIVGYGSYRYVSGSKSRTEREWFKVGFSPRKQATTLYIMDGFTGYDDLLGRLGTHSTGKACLYIKDLEKVDKDVLTELIAASVAAHEETDSGTD